MKRLYSIALCDDETKELDLIESFLKKYQDTKQKIEYKIKRFESAETLLDWVREERYTPDLLLLDIFMSGKTGMEVAEELRDLGFDIPIVFLTASTEYALKAYGVDAIQYLVKPLEQERFFHAMDHAIDHISNGKKDQIMIKITGGFRPISPSDILYCESQKNYQILHLIEEEHKIRITAAKLWDILKHFSPFRKCGRAYILNMDHIVSVEREKIVMDNGSTIYISRNQVAGFKKSYFSYYFDHDDENSV